MQPLKDIKEASPSLHVNLGDPAPETYRYKGYELIVRKCGKKSFDIKAAAREKPY